MVKSTTYGFFILLTSALAYASYGIFSKIIGNAFAPFTQVWTRSIITLLCFILFCFYKNFFVKIRKEDIKWFIVVGVVGSLALAPTFYSLANLNIGTALFIQYAATVITSYILGSLILREKLTKISIIALASAFVGLLLVYWGDIHFEAGKIVPVLAACVSGTLFSFWFVFSKKISSKYPTALINVYGYIFAIAVNFMIAAGLKESFNSDFTSTAWFANVGYGFAGFAGSGLAIYGFKFIEAHKGSIILLSEIVFGVLFGLLLFHEILSITTILGGILIGVSVVLPNIYEMLSKQNLAQSLA
ncbi:MAG: DMT family transporter [Patescibacteria group bacterium]|nr:DMT family transporter [Patescibacteria group bacterium]MDE2015477.1 DMT family transporter [Patescibacteria group bacterium]MDE2226907.1 DMT family transporter [Patescibacteria group bacterium]